MGKRRSTAEIISIGKELYGEKFTYEKTVYVDCKTPIVVTCPKHGDMQKHPITFVAGQSGCKKCNAEKSKLSTDVFIKKAIAIHGDKYDYSKVNYIKSDAYVEVLCHQEDEHGREHGAFMVTPHAHIGAMRSGCPKCSRKYHYSTDEWIAKAVSIHGDKYDYSKAVYESCHKKVCIICHKIGADGNEHGEFWVEPNSHTGNMKSGCRKCMGEMLGDLNRIWDYDACYKEALKYTCSSAFAKGNASACGIAQKKDWIKDYYWFSTPPKYSGDINAKIHIVYAYFFPNNTVYIGRTSHPKNRDRHHRNPYKHTDGSYSTSIVYKYAKELEISIPTMKILEEGLNLEESRIREDYWLKLYITEGYNVLNSGKTGRNSGSIGAFTRVWTIERIRETARNFPTIAAFTKAFPAGVAAMRKYNLHKELFPNRRFFRIVEQRSTDGDMVNRYKSATEAARVNNYNASLILEACKKKKVYKGYLWNFGN